jgi:GT2 family glycosyltransferase
VNYPGKLAAVIVNRNGGALVLRCIRALLEGSRAPDIVVVVDNNSTDASDQRIQQEFTDVCLLRSARNVGYGAALNLGAEEACRRGAFLLLLMNDDVILDSSTIEILLQHWGPDVGLAGPKVFRLDQKETLDAAWGEILFHQVICRMVGENSPDSPQFSRLKEVDALLGCMLLTSCSVLDDAGFLDPDYFMYLEEIDFAFRVRRLGKSILFIPDARAWHAGGHSTSAEARRAVKTFYVRRNAVLFLRKHGNVFRWCKFLLFALASLISSLLTFRWSDLVLRMRGYREGFRVKISRK